MVNGQPCMPDSAACVRHREGYVKQFLTYITVGKKIDIEGAFMTTSPDPWQLPATKVGLSGGKDLTSIMCQKCFGRPIRLRPQRFQCTRLSHQWFSSNATKMGQMQMVLA